MKNHAFIAATAYAKAGLSVIPIWANGKKSLALQEGERKPFEKKIATDEQLAKWFNRQQPFAVGILGGEVSGHLECIDFDLDAEIIFPQFTAIINAENDTLMERLVVNRTPRPGYHVVYRVSNTVVCGSKKLACKPIIVDGKERRETIIESRGEGGYFVAPGSPPAASPYKNSLTWTHHSGPKLSKVQTITAHERDLLWSVARSFNGIQNSIRHQSPDSLSVGDDYDRRGPDITEIIGPHGWTSANGIHWKRPGKTTEGISATWGIVRSKDDLPLFHPFSTNCYPLEENRNYGKYRLYALLNHNGDYSAATKALAAIGYGEQPKQKQQPQQKRRLSPVAEAAIKLIESLPEDELDEVITMLEAQLESSNVGR